MKMHLHNNLRLLKLLSLTFMLCTSLSTPAHTMDGDWDCSIGSLDGANFFPSSQESSRANSPKGNVADADDEDGREDEEAGGLVVAEVPVVKDIVFVPYDPKEAEAVHDSDESEDSDGELVVDEGGNANADAEIPAGLRGRYEVNAIVFADRTVPQQEAPANGRKRRASKQLDPDYENKTDSSKMSSSGDDDSDYESEHEKEKPAPRKRRCAGVGKVTNLRGQGLRQHVEAAHHRKPGEKMTEQERLEIAAALREHLEKVDSTNCVPEDIWKDKIHKRTLHEHRAKLGLGKEAVAARKKAAILAKIADLNTRGEKIVVLALQKEFRCAPKLICDCVAELGLSPKDKIRERQAMVETYVLDQLRVNPNVAFETLNAHIKDTTGYGFRRQTFVAMQQKLADEDEADE